MADKRYGVSERRETYPIAAFSIDERMRCVEGGRDDIAAKSQLGVGSSNLGQGLAASQGGRAGAGAVGSHFDGRLCDDVRIRLKREVSVDEERVSRRLLGSSCRWKGIAVSRCLCL